MRYVKVLDNIAKNITRDGVAELGEGYEKTDDINKADAILVRASDIHGLDFGPSVRCVARSGAGPVVAAVHHTAGSVVRVAVEDKVAVVGHLAVGAQQKRRGIQVEVAAAIIAVDVPAQTHGDFAQAGIALRQVDLLPFFQ